jgi:hypothetical protein
MNDLIVVPQTNQWQKLKALVLDSVSSPITEGHVLRPVKRGDQVDGDAT